MILKLFEKLNNPIAVTLIMVAILAVNGFLFYQQRSTPPEANAPEETSAQTSETTDEPDEEAKGEGSEDSKGPEEDASEPDESEDAKGREEEPDGEQNGEQASNGQNDESEGSDESEDPSDEEEPPEEEPSEEASPEEEPQNDGNGGPDDESQNGEEESAPEESASDESDSDGESDGSGESGRTPLAGLGDALEECEGDRGECVRGFVSEVSPDSRYIGGRTDLASGSEGDNAEILYFEDPEMDACQFERGRHETQNGLDYTVILVGPGSFNDERGEECIPTT
jgi:hypothetical protein